MERIVQANGVELWCEDFGAPTDPAILLIMGIRTSGRAWPDRVCRTLADAGYRVVRYDHRDTGRSTALDFEQSPYTLTDMAADAVGILDALAIDAAHVVGASMGGMVAQEMAIEFPARVVTLTSVISTPAVPDPGIPAGWSRGLPPTRPEMVAVFAEAELHPPTTREERVEFHLRTARALAGTLGLFDEEEARRVCEQEIDHESDADASGNHGLALAVSRDRTEALASVTVPTLVVHGSVDPIFPYEHGIATARAIPGARLVTVEGLGHELPPNLAELVLEHVRGQVAPGR